MTRIRMLWAACAEWVAVLAALTLLSGCVGGSSHREGHKRTVSHVHMVGGFGAMAVNLNVTIDSQEASDEDEKHEAHVDTAAIGEAVAVALKAAGGGFGAGEVASAVGLAVTSAAGLAGMWAKSREAALHKQRADEHKADAAEGWSKATGDT